MSFPASPPQASRPIALSDVARTGPAPPASSPFISLSAQCDLLYTIGSQVHPYAVLNDATVQSRGCGKLRFLTPSPFLLATSAAVTTSSIEGVHHSGKQEVGHEYEENESERPRVLVSSPPASVFPTLAQLEDARRQNDQKSEKREKESVHQPHRMALHLQRRPDGLHGVSQTQALLPSGPQIARSNYERDFQWRSLPPTSTAGTMKKREREESEAVGGNGAVVHTAEKTAALLPSPPVQYFPSATVLRHLLHLLLSMHASAKNTAATFTVHRYRRVSLSSSVHLYSERNVRVVGNEDCLAFDILPRVVSEWQDGSKLQYRHHDGGGFCLLPGRGPLLLSQSSNGSSATSNCIYPGRLLCFPVDFTAADSSSFSDLVPPGAACDIEYSTLCGPAFREACRWCNITATVAPSAQPPMQSLTASIYWNAKSLLTHGVFGSLFTFPCAADPQASPSTHQPEGGINTAIESRETAAVSSVPVDYHRFLKTNAFIFLSFLVHFVWCRVVMDEVRHQIMKKKTGSNQQCSCRVVQAVCMPDLHCAVRSPQFSWESLLLFASSSPSSPSHVAVQNGAPNDHQYQQSPLSEETVEVVALGQWQEMMIKSDKNAPSMEYCVVRVVNRAAELRWRFSSNKESLVCSTMGESCRTGTLDALLSAVSEKLHTS